jgi:hypothetical protein
MTDSQKWGAPSALHPEAFPRIAPIEFATDKSRLYQISEILDAGGFHACASDVRAAADYIETMRAKKL